MNQYFSKSIKYQITEYGEKYKESLCIHPSPKRNSQYHKFSSFFYLKYRKIYEKKHNSSEISI